MLNDFKKIKTMGVINVTPNSFSDPKKFFHTDQLLETLSKYNNHSNFLFDFGFESTAPMNNAITESEERIRFDQFFKQIEGIDLNGEWISFDTYRVESFRYFTEQFKTRYKAQGFVFNDVSGVIDEDLLLLLKDNKDNPAFKYIHSFSHIPSRDLTLKHMSYVREGDIFPMALNHFKAAEKNFRENNVLSSIIFDPGFGFSKSYEQNWSLLEKFAELQSEFDKNQSWLVGLSKKSFLRKSLPENCPDPFSEAEKLHLKLIKKILKNNYHHTMFRVHDFDIVNKAGE
jgi:dihydropteroate synthase